MSEIILSKLYFNARPSQTLSLLATFSELWKLLLMPPSVSWKGRISSITGKAVTVCQLLALRQFCWTKENAKPPQKWFLLLVYKLRAVSIGRKPGRYFMVKGLYWVLSSGSWSSNAFAWLWVKQSKERREARLFPKCKILLSCQLALHNWYPSFVSAHIHLIIEN